MAVEPAGRSRLPTATQEKLGPVLLEKAKSEQWASADDDQPSSREDMCSDLKSLSVTYARFGVMSLQDKCLEIRNQIPVAPWLVTLRLAHISRMLSELCSLLLKIYSKAERDRHCHMCLPSVTEQPWTLGVGRLHTPHSCSMSFLCEMSPCSEVGPLDSSTAGC